MSTQSKEVIFRGSPYYYEKVRGITLGERELDFLSINTPPACNYRCQFCLAGMKSRRRFRSSLTAKKVIDLITEARDLGVFHLEISGEGEPLLYKELLKEIIDFATQLGIHTTIFTNGFLLTEAFIRHLARQDMSMAISLDYLKRERYEKFVGKANTFNRVIRNIELSRRIFTNRITVENGYKILPLAIHTIVMRDNITTLFWMRKFAGKTIFFSLAPLMNRGNAREHSDLLAKTLQTRSVIKKYSDGSLILSDSSYSTIGKPVCGTFYYGLGVRYDGEVLFDAHAYDTAGLLGNVKNEALSNLVKKLRNLQKIYFKKFSDGGFCPLRNPNFDRFIRYLKNSPLNDGANSY